LLTDWEVRCHIVSIGKKLYEHRLVAATDGNISVKMKADKIIISPGGHCLGTLDFNHMVHVDNNGKRTSGELEPSSELPMHLEIYHQRPDVNAVIHAHPPITTAFTLVGENLSDPVLPEVILFFGEIPVAPYATPSTVESANSISGLIKNHDVIVLDHHGAVTVGETLKDAYYKMEKLEQSANILYAAKQLGKIKPLSDEDLKKLLSLKAEYNYKS
jgi:L-fuculose-phosphate aldolase